MKVTANRDFIRNYDGEYGEASFKSEQVFQNSFKKPHHSSNHNYKEDRLEAWRQEIDHYPSRKYQLEIFTSSGTHPCGEDRETGYLKTTRSASDVTYTSWTQEYNNSQTIGTTAITKSDFTEYTRRTVGHQIRDFNNPISDESENKDKNQFTREECATYSVDKKGSSATEKTERLGGDGQGSGGQTSTEEVGFGYTGQSFVSPEGGSKKYTHESPEYYSSKWMARGTSYTSSVWDPDASSTKKSNFTIMETGNLPVTTIDCVPFNQFTTSSFSGSRVVKKETKTFTYVDTVISRITRDVTTLGVETKSVWTFWKDGASSHENAAYVDAFTLEEDNPFFSFMCMETRGFESLWMDMYRSITAKVTLTPRVNGAYKSDQYKACKFADDTAITHGVKMKATDKFFSNKITTWKKNKVARSSYHEVCGVHDGDDEVVGKRDDPITFVSQTSAANYTTRFYSCGIEHMDRLEAMDFSYTITDIKPDTSSTKIDGNMQTIDYTISDSESRYSGTSVTSTDTSLDSSEEGYTLSDHTPTFYVNSPAGRVVAAGYDTHKIEVPIKQTSSTTSIGFIVPFIEKWQTYNRVQLVSYDIDSPDCIDSSRADPSPPTENTDPLEDSDYTVANSEIKTDPCDSWADFKSKRAEKDRENSAFQGAYGTADGVPYVYDPDTVVSKATSFGECGAFLYGKTEKVAYPKARQESYTMKFNLGSGVSSSKLFETGLVRSDTFLATVLTTRQPAGFPSFFQGFEQKRDYASTISGTTTMPETSKRFSSSEKVTGSDVRFFSVNSCGYRHEVPEGTTVTFSGVAWTFKPKPSVQSYYQLTQNVGIGGGGNKINNKFEYSFEIKDEARIDINDVYLRLAHQCALEIWEPYVTLKNHWQPFSSKGTNGDFFFSFKESNYQPIAKGGGNYGGYNGHGQYSHSDFEYDEDIRFLPAGRGMNQAWVPATESAYLISSSARSYEKEYYSDGDYSMTTSTYVRLNKGAMPSVLTFSDDDTGQYHLFGATRYGSGSSTNGDTYLYSAELEELESTSTYSSTYESTSSYRANGQRETEETTVTHHSVRWKKCKIC